MCKSMDTILRNKKGRRSKREGTRRRQSRRDKDRRKISEEYRMEEGQNERRD